MYDLKNVSLNYNLAVGVDCILHYLLLNIVQLQQFDILEKLQIVDWSGN